MPNTQEMVERISAFRAGAAVSQMIVLGDRLGLYQAMRGTGPVTAAELAELVWPRAGGDAERQLRSRWLHEWLLGQAAAGIVQPVEQAGFCLPKAAAEVLADEDSLASLIGAFATVPVQGRLAEHVIEAMRSGTIDPARWRGEDAIIAVERMRRPWIKGILVPLVVPSLAGIGEKLRSGAKVADLCCGSGLSTIELALEYECSTFIGFDTAEPALHRAVARAEQQGAVNARFKVADACAVAEHGPFDLILALDAMHEVPDPAALAKAVRAAIADDGVWLIEDPAGDMGTEAKRTGDLTLATLYAGSVLSCLPASLPSAGESALGSVGFTERVAEQVCRDAGFREFRSLDLGMASYRHFEARP